MRPIATKSRKVRDYFIANPNAKATEVGKKFKCAMPVVYKIRKEVLAGYVEPTPKPFVPSKHADGLQVGGDHYKTMGIQPWKAMESWLTPDEFSGFLKGNAIKYLARCNAKGGLEDVKKARHYLDKLIEVNGE
jgi:hypothetical protein